MRATDREFQAARRRVSLSFSASGIANRGRPARPAGRRGGPSPSGTRRARNRLVPGRGRARLGKGDRWREPLWFRINGTSVNRGGLRIAPSCDLGSLLGG